MSFPSSGKTVLFLTDDALSVYKTQGAKVEYVGSVDWKENLFDDLASSMIMRECGRRPVIILNDMVEQHYRKERLPKVGPMDKAQVLKRRLQVAFPSYPVRAALPSKDKTAPVTKGAAGVPQGGLYLFAAVPSSEALTKTLNVVRKSQVPVSGFGLLPVESAGMVAALAKKLGGEEKGKTQWGIFVGQHQSGGLRQVITRNGELALTRMTSMTGLDLDPGAWAREVANEFKSTMSYLARFGYGGDDVLDVMIVSEAEAAKHLKAMIDTPCRLHLLLAQEAAQNLGLKLKGQDSARYADAIHAAWSGKKAKMTLPMEARQIAEISKPRQAAMMAMLVMFGAFAFMGYQIFTSSMSVLKTGNEINKAEARLVIAQKDYEAEVQRQEQLGLDVRLIQNSIKVYDELKGEGVNFIPLAQSIGQALGDVMKIDAVRIDGAGDTVRRNPNQQASFGNNNDAEEEREYTANLLLSFRPDIPPEAAVNEVNKLQGRLQTLMPDYEVEITKQAFDMSTSAAFMGESGNVTAEDVEEADYTAEIAIKGAMR